MTITWKVSIAALLTAATGAGIYEARQASIWRSQAQTLQQQATASAGDIERLNGERNDAVARQAALESENERLRQAVNELPNLRAEVARLRATEQQRAQSKSTSPKPDDPFTQSVLTLTSRTAELYQHLGLRPERRIPELQFLTETDWLMAAKEAKSDTEADIRKALAHLRSLAKQRLPFAGALSKFTADHDGELPASLSELKPYFPTPIDDAILDRYRLPHAGNITNFPPGTWFILEKAPVDRDYDSRSKFGNGCSTSIATGIGEAGDPDDPSY